MVEGPIVDFYPEDFEQDMNGKKSDWEAVVKVPFIDEKRLIAALKCNLFYFVFLLKARNYGLSKLESSRNVHGSSFSFAYQTVSKVYPSSLQGSFPDLFHCYCDQTNYSLPEKSKSGFYNKLCINARTGAKLLPGFPSLSMIDYRASIAHGGVCIFQSPSSNESVIVHSQPALDIQRFIKLLNY